MKRGIKPTRRVKQIIKQKGLNPANWLVTKQPPGELYIMHRATGKQRIIFYGRRMDNHDKLFTTRLAGKEAGRD